MNTGLKIRSVREQRNMSQDELAQKLSVTQSMIGQIERGTKAISFAMAVDIAKVLEVDIHDLM